MDFEFTPEQLEFVKEVEEFLDVNDDPEVFDLTICISAFLGLGRTLRVLGITETSLTDV